jgi:hypothetical protein
MTRVMPWLAPLLVLLSLSASFGNVRPYASGNVSTECGPNR